MWDVHVSPWQGYLISTCLNTWVKRGNIKQGSSDFNKTVRWLGLNLHPAHSSQIQVAVTARPPYHYAGMYLAADTSIRWTVGGVLWLSATSKIMVQLTIILSNSDCPFVSQ